MPSDAAARRLIVLLAAALALGACARSAPGLPPDLSHLPVEQRLLPGDLESPDAKLDCPTLVQNAAKDRELAAQLEDAIASNRQHNQAVGYAAAVLFPPLWFATRSDSEVKTTLDTLQTRRDRLDRLVVARKCSPAGAT